MEARRRLLNDIVNTPIPKDIVKFSNKLFGLCLGILTKKGVQSAAAQRLTVDVLKMLMEENVIENEFLLQTFNEGRVKEYD